MVTCLKLLSLRYRKSDMSKLDTKKSFSRNCVLISQQVVQKLRVLGFLLALVFLASIAEHKVVQIFHLTELLKGQLKQTG